jgi:hypothetical protein
MRASLAAIHFHACRPTCPTTMPMDALLITIRNECELCIPELKRVRPPNSELSSERAAEQRQQTGADARRLLE